MRREDEGEAAEDAAEAEERPERVVKLRLKRRPEKKLREGGFGLEEVE